MKRQNHATRVINARHMANPRTSGYRVCNDHDEPCIDHAFATSEEAIDALRKLRAENPQWIAKEKR